MAKCMQSKKNKKDVIRISNQEAKKLYSTGNWNYISKSDFNRIQNGYLNGNGVNNQSKG